MRAKQLKSEIILPVLHYLQLPDIEAATELLLMTAATETDMCQLIRQVGGGPALGVYQMEPVTARDMLTYLDRKPDLKAKVLNLSLPGIGVIEQLPGNLYLATALARVRYLPAPAAMPDSQDFAGLARYYRVYYNRGGAATDENTLKKYLTYVVKG